MKKNELAKIFKSMNFFPSRKLGQNFLVDINFLDYIIRITEPQKNEHIIEFGPGFGALTEKLLEKNVNLSAVEYDKRLAEFLKNKYDKFSNFNLIQADACKLNFQNLVPPNNNYRCIANLPYSVSSIIIAKIIELKNPPKQMFFMLQQEMAQRISSPYGKKNYGILSVKTQLFYNIRILKNLNPDVFYPPPEINSTFMVFNIKKSHPPQKFLPILDKILRTVFTQRRKQIKKLLKNEFGPKILAILDELQIPYHTRPAQISPDSYLKLAHKLFNIYNN